MSSKDSQTLAVKRAQVEFHNFASLGEPERAIGMYEQENVRRKALIDKHRSFMGRLSPFLEIGASAGHTSYMLCNEFAADGFALDLSADALRHGIVLQERWGLARAPVRVAGDALNLPFRDGSLRMVMAFQMLSQFLDIESVFLEVRRVLAPGGIFFLSEEPLKRMLSLRLYRSPYYETMKPWERKLFDWGLLGFLVRDVIGADQEESFGIRQNHTMGLKDWQRLIERHFGAQEYEIFVPRRGWAEPFMAKAARAFDKHHSDWVPARLLGGTISAFCRKRGQETETTGIPISEFERYFRCPDCKGGLRRDALDTLRCGACGYEAPLEGGVYNLLPSAEKKELYPGDREDLIDFCQANHERFLLDGWYGVEGVFGNKFRWIGPRATARLRRVRPGPQRLRVRGFAPEQFLNQADPPRIEMAVNGQSLGVFPLSRNGLFLFEAPVPSADEFILELKAAPVWRHGDDRRDLTVNISSVRLVEDSPGI